VWCALQATLTRVDPWTHKAGVQTLRVSRVSACFGPDNVFGSTGLKRGRTGCRICGLDDGVALTYLRGTMEAFTVLGKS
jgi:hypothetical protein